MAAKSVDNSRPCELDVSHSGSPSDRNEAPALPIRSISSSSSRVERPSRSSHAPHAAGNFLTPSGKCEFKASMPAGGNFVLPLFRQGSNEFQAGESVDALPTYIPPRESPATNPGLAAKYPLNVISPKSHAFLNSSYGNLPAQLHHAGEQVVIINPKDALARNVGEGSAVRIFNDRGSFEAIAKVSADVMQGIVIAPLGYWRTRAEGKAR